MSLLRYGNRSLKSASAHTVQTRGLNEMHTNHELRLIKLPNYSYSSLYNMHFPVHMYCQREINLYCHEMCISAVILQNSDRFV